MSVSRGRMAERRVGRRRKAGKGFLMTVPPGLVTDAVAEARRVLGPCRDADWSVPALELDWSCWQAGVHVADSLVFYASQIIDQKPASWVPFELVMADDATPDDLLRAIGVGGAILDRTVTAADPADRGYHIYGSSDAGGFAAMGAIETLVHTYDIAQALGTDWRPPGELCAPVLDRLFPDAPAGDPQAVLLWCAGRSTLGDRPRQTDWRWDGTVRA
jgi:hypothetical protein